MKSIIHLGTFDVPNYGDLLFPLIARKRLEKEDIHLEFVSPAGGEPVWSDCVPSINLDTLVRSGAPIDGILIGGGNIIRLTPSNLQYYQKGLTPFLGYASLWIGISKIAPNIPICWNAPGVPHVFPSLLRGLVKKCIRASNYIAVRDSESRAFLTGVDGKADIAIVPDTAWEIDSLWDKGTLRATYNALLAENGITSPEKTVAIHLNARYLGKMNLKQIAQQVDLIAQRVRARPILLAIGPCHGDDMLARDVAMHMLTHPILIDNPKSLIEIASSIAFSEAYIGSSMHGFITASAFHVPAICVIDGKLVKFNGLRRMFGDIEILAVSWPDAVSRISEMNFDDRRRQLALIHQRVLKTLDNHWVSIQTALKAPVSHKHNVSSSKRRRLLAIYKWGTMARLILIAFGRHLKRNFKMVNRQRKRSRS